MKDEITAIDPPAAAPGATVVTKEEVRARLNAILALVRPISRLTTNKIDDWLVAAIDGLAQSDLAMDAAAMFLTRIL